MPNGHCVETLNSLRTLYGSMARRSVRIMCCFPTFSVETLWEICRMSLEFLWPFCRQAGELLFNVCREICRTSIDNSVDSLLNFCGFYVENPLGVLHNCSRSSVGILLKSYRKSVAMRGKSAELVWTFCVQRVKHPVEDLENFCGHAMEVLLKICGRRMVKQWSVCMHSPDELHRTC